MIEVKNGLRIINNEETLNFALTSMQIASLLLFDKNFNLTDNVSLPKNIDELRFTDLFAKIILLKKEEEITLFKDELTLFYVAVNLASQCFVNEKEDVIKLMLPYLGELTEEEFKNIRDKYIQKAQDTINMVNETFRYDTEVMEELKILSDGMIKMVSGTLD